MSSSVTFTVPSPSAAPAPVHTGKRAVRRGALAVALVIGVGLIAAPLVFGMFARAPKGATMLTSFRPFMTESRLDGFDRDISTVDAGVRAAGTARSAVPNTPAPAYDALREQWPGIDAKMTGLLGKVHANLGNYRAVAALPSFELFPWFFVAPGILIAVAAAVALTGGKWFGPARVALVLVGVGLIAAPLVFQMFSRAPAGGRMMAAFRTIETATNVGSIQADFATMAAGQGDIRLTIVPALERSGLTEQQIAQRYPAVTALDAQWVHILNDMTPMIGAMSDSVVDYDAIASLPPFPLFPWFFVIPDVLVAVAAGVAAPRRERSAP